MKGRATLGDALPMEQDRCRELLGAYREIGPAGSFGVAVISAALGRADQAVISGDIVEMIKAYNELKELE